MADILIHRCTLRIVRRGGWSWGPDPKRLVQEAIRVLPVLLAQKLAELLASTEDVEFAAPLRIMFRMRMSELIGVSPVARGSDVSSGPEVAAALEKRVEAALRATFGLPPLPTESGAKKNVKPVPRFTAKTSHGIPGQRGALASLLLTWHAEGSLQRRLTLLLPAEVELWHAALMADCGQRARTSAASTSDQSDQVETAARKAAAGLSSDLASPLIVRLAVAAAVACELHTALSDSVLWEVVDRLVPATENRVLDTRRPAETSPENPPRRFDAKPSESVIDETVPGYEPASLTASGIVDSSDWDVRIGCALPFLLLGPLLQVGYLSTLAAVLEAAGLEEDPPLFAAALAYKVLEAPERGWNRRPESRLAAATFAGVREPIEEELLVEFSRRIGPHTSALDETLADALIAGHRPNSPVLLCRADLPGSPGWLLIDTPGGFPIACGSHSESMLSLLNRLGRPIVLISEDAAETSLLAGLDAAGVHFISKLPPARNERWRRIQRGSSTLGWTNSQTGDLELLQKAAQELEAGAGEAQALWQALAILRPGVVNSQSMQFERSLTLAAAVGLGTISWQLWHARGRATPHQALDHYHDFDAQVCFRPESITVRLPLGRRRSSLYEAGLLASIGDVPWFGDRRVEYEGG